jgi:hypothetical protein
VKQRIGCYQKHGGRGTRKIMPGYAVMTLALRDENTGHDLDDGESPIEVDNHSEAALAAEKYGLE